MLEDLVSAEIFFIIKTPHIISIQANQNKFK